MQRRQNPHGPTRFSALSTPLSWIVGICIVLPPPLLFPFFSPSIRLYWPTLQWPVGAENGGNLRTGPCSNQVGCRQALRLAVGTRRQKEAGAIQILRRAMQDVESANQMSDLILNVSDQIDVARAHANALNRRSDAASITLRRLRIQKLAVDRAVRSAEEDQVLQRRRRRAETNKKSCELAPFACSGELVWRKVESTLDSVSHDGQVAIAVFGVLIYGTVMMIPTERAKANVGCIVILITVFVLTTLLADGWLRVVLGDDCHSDGWKPLPSSFLMAAAATGLVLASFDGVSLVLSSTLGVLAGTLLLDSAGMTGERYTGKVAAGVVMFFFVAWLSSLTISNPQTGPSMALSVFVALLVASSIGRLCAEFHDPHARVSWISVVKGMLPHGPLSLGNTIVGNLGLRVVWLVLSLISLRPRPFDKLRDQSLDCKEPRTNLLDPQVQDALADLKMSLAELRISLQPVQEALGDPFASLPGTATPNKEPVVGDVVSDSIPVAPQLQPAQHDFGKVASDEISEIPKLGPPAG